MRNRASLSQFLVVVLAGWGGACLPGRSQETTVAEEVSTLEEKFRAEYEQVVGAPFEKQLAKLKKNYAAAIDRHLEEATAKGDLEGALALRNEKKTLEGSGEVEAKPDPGEAADEVPAILQTLRATYRQESTRINASRDAAFATVAKQFDGALNAYQKQLTQAGKLDDALVVKKYRESGLASRLGPGKLAAKATTTSSDQPVRLTFSEGSAPGDAMENTLKMKLRWIPAGTYLKGSPESETGRSKEEIQIEVRLSDNFWIGQHEVTQAEYKSVAGSNPSHHDSADEFLPVESVTWAQAMAFCNALSERERKAGFLPGDWNYTLPSEAQWEYACRAGAEAPLNNGKDITADKGACPNLDAVAWYAANSGNMPHPVGQKSPNAWGLHDVHGNVGEWCRNWFLSSYWLRLVADGEAKIKDPPGAGPPGSGLTTHSLRVVRGGNYQTQPGQCRSAYPHKENPDAGHPGVGFRVILWKGRE